MRKRGVPKTARETGKRSEERENRKLERERENCRERFGIGDWITKEGRSKTRWGKRKKKSLGSRLLCFSL